MPLLNKINAETFNTREVKKTKNCLPVIQVLDGNKVEVSDDLDILVQRGEYKHIVFVPDAMLGEIRWTRVFNKTGKKQYNQIATKTGVLFLFH